MSVQTCYRSDFFLKIFSMRKLKKEDKVFLTDFGKKMKKLRKKRGWTLEYCEEKGYPSWNHLQKIESGKKAISIFTIKNLAKLYHMSISDLFKEIA